MNIVLIGYRGTGKSAVGAILGEQLKMKCVAMDEEIVRRAGMPVPQIVEREGWPGFRDRETRLARELAGRDDIIIDCGGGVIERPENMEALRSGGTVFWLTASVETIVGRIMHDTQRPALVEGKTFTEEVAEVLGRRTPIYRSSAHHDIDTDRRTPREVAGEVMRLLEDGGGKVS